MEFHVIIPARYASTRLPGKPLRDIAGKPMIQHVYERGQESGASSVTVATDDLRVEAVVREFGGDVCLTSDRHRSGSDRLAEAAAILGLADDAIIVNLQGDEPLMSPALVRDVAGMLENDDTAEVATACVAIDDPLQVMDPHVVKVVRDRENRALYFSRAPIPWLRDVGGAESRRAWRHIGLYAYRCGYLQSFTQLEPCWLEEDEALEQLRILWNGGRIDVFETDSDPGHGVDTEQDLLKVRRQFGDTSV